MFKKGMVLFAVFMLSVGVVFPNGQTETVGIKDPVTIYVTVAVGGALDVRARVVAEYLSEELGVPVNVENVGGAGGITCATQMLTNAHSENDLIFTGVSTFTASPVFTETIYSIDDFRPLAAVDVESFGLFTCPARTGFKTFEDVVAFAGNNEVIFGSGGVGNVTHLYQAGLYKELGFPKTNTLTHNGAVIGITNCMGGHNMITMAGLETARSYVENGDIVPVVTFNSEAYTGYDGYVVPSVLDVGGDEMVCYQSLMVIASLASIPEGNAKIIQDALMKVLQNPDCQADLKAVGLIETPVMTTEEMVDYIKNEFESIKSIVDLIS